MTTRSKMVATGLAAFTAGTLLVPAMPKTRDVDCKCPPGVIAQTSTKKQEIKTLQRGESVENVQASSSNSVQEYVGEQPPLMAPPSAPPGYSGVPSASSQTKIYHYTEVSYEGKHISGFFIKNIGFITEHGFTKGKGEYYTPVGYEKVYKEYMEECMRRVQNEKIVQQHIGEKPPMLTQERTPPAYPEVPKAINQSTIYHYSEVPYGGRHISGFLVKGVGFITEHGFTKGEGQYYTPSGYKQVYTEYLKECMARMQSGNVHVVAQQETQNIGEHEQKAIKTTGHVSAEARKELSTAPHVSRLHSSVKALVRNRWQAGSAREQHAYENWGQWAQPYHGWQQREGVYSEEHNGMRQGIKSPEQPNHGITRGWGEMQGQTGRMETEQPSFAWGTHGWGFGAGGAFHGFGGRR